MNLLVNRTRKEAYGLVFKQLIGVLLLSTIALILTGGVGGFSCLAGGLAYVIPNFLFVWRVFRFNGASQMTQFVSAFFLFEAIKLILSGMLFILIVKYLPVSLLSVLIGFIGAIISFWIVSMCQFTKPKTAKQLGAANG